MAKNATIKKRPTVSENYENIHKLAMAHNHIAEELRGIRKEQNEGLLKLLSRVVQERPETSFEICGK